MKKTIALLMGGLLVYSNALAQNESPSDTTPVVESIEPEEAPAVVDEEAIIDGEEVPPAVGEEGGEIPPLADGEEVPPAEEQPIADDDGGLLISGARINDIFQLLARRAGKQYFHNNRLNTEDYNVTGHLNGDAGALKQMEELAFQYGLRMYVKGNTVYAMLDEQLSQLPAKEWVYQLKYLRPTDIEQIRALIQPLLSPGRGIVNYEPKTNSVVVIDTVQHIESVERILSKIDKPKGQIVVEVKILSINSNAGHSSGVDWTSSLGSSGVNVDIARSLNSVFGLTGDFAATAVTGGGNASTTETLAGASNIILTPLQLSGVLRALNEGNLVKTKSNPVVITEDNENAIVSLIDRVPIITSTVNDNGAAGSTTSDEVRYTIDESDSVEPESTREIGVTISVTPSLLPDGTIRMRMRPRNASIVENITGPSGNIYPRVSEATIESIARIPDGHSLIVGGFYGETESSTKSKIPLLGDVPVFKFFFKSKQTVKEQASLIFIVTPTSYDPTCVRSHQKVYKKVENHSSVKPGYDNVDPRNPGAAHDSNLRRTINGMRKKVYELPDNYPQP